LEIAQLPREVDCVPKEHAIKILTPNRTDQSFDERMRKSSQPHPM
jgi:hypothetical protein